MVASKLFLYNGVKKKKKSVKKMGQLSGTHISQTAGLISFIFRMLSRIYGGHKICEFDRNQPSDYRDTRG